MKSHLAIAAVFLALLGPHAALANDDPCIGPDIDLGYDIRTEARWQIATGEKLVRLVRVKEPHLYEICRSFRLSEPGAIRISTPAQHADLELQRGSCLVVYANDISIISDAAIGRGDVVTGSYRRLGEEQDPVFNEDMRFMMQTMFHTDVDHRIPLSILHTRDQGGAVQDAGERIFRFCQATRPAVDDPYPGNWLPGISIEVDGTPSNRYPLDYEKAVFGSGTCVDLQGRSLEVRAMRGDNPAIESYLSCGRLAFGL